MSKRFRKMTALLLAVVMVTLMIPITTISVSAGTVIENAISWALGIADDDSHGYSQLQNRRWGNPDYDCSTFVITAFANAGCDVEGATYTGNMRSVFENAGFTWIPKSQIDLSNSSQLVRGDILLNEANHTEIYIGNNQRVGAHTGTYDIYDRNSPGDNNGREISIYNYSNSSNWDGVLRYNDEQIHNPIGAIETIENSNGQVHVSGWAYDPDNTSAALQIHVYVGGEYGNSSVVSAHSNIIANKDSSHIEVGGYHRFDEYLETTARGNQSVFIYAIDATGDGPMMIGSNNIIINTLPTGRVESFSGGNAKIHVAGWVYDPDNSTDSLRLDVYIGGAYGETSVVSAHSIYADKDSDDVNNKFGITGKHRFDAWINTSADENQPIYVYAIDSNEPNQNYMIGSDNVIINHNPLGHIDSINEIPGGYCVSGWTFDPDKPSESISVHFYTGAPYGNESAEGFNSGITDLESEDVNNQYGITGKHRFCKKIYTNKTGDQTIYMYGMKIDSYYHPITYQANIFLSSNPVAELEEFQYDNEEVYIKGWAYDKENINYPLNIRIYCDEELISTAIANENSEDINSSHAGKIGNDHRFESRINYNTTNISYGVHKIKIVAENIANGIDYTIDERNIVISRVGDTNLDRNITIGDVTSIQRHLAELEAFTDEQLSLADTNGDGEINISDATHLQMYLAEYDGIVLGKS